MKFKITFLFFAFAINHGFAQTFVSNTDESKVPPYTLPNPLQQANGNIITSAKQWNKLQRPYIYHLFEENVYGKFPQKNIPLKYSIREENNNALNGLAIRKQVRLYFHPADSSIYLDILLYLPKNAKKPVPVFTGLNFSGNQTVANDPAIFLAASWVASKPKGVLNNRSTDSSRGTNASQWQVEEILKAGYGLATAYYGDLEPDNVDGWKTGIRTSLKNILQIEPEEWSAMGAWAWGLSRIMDYLQQEKKVAIMGFSRLGKAALWSAAGDQRFAMVISNESGEGGAALSKRWYGETVAIINQKFPHWFAEKYKTYGDNTAALPLDQHMLLALMAPRPLYVASAEGDQWSDPRGEFLGAKNAEPVYALFNKKGLEVDNMPGLHQPVGNTIRYHYRAGRHDVLLYDWQQFLRFADDTWK